VEVDVVALINDTTGILLSEGNEVHVPDCYIGLALGEGTNACYMEELSAIPKFSGDGRHTKVIVNTEWCSFGDDGKLRPWRNKYDDKLDKKSSNPGQQL
jgi:hexokinase